jgi:hypothetical protein
MTIIISSSSDLLADPDRVVRQMREGRVIRLSDMGYTLGPSSGFALADAENDEAADMVSLRTEVTGVDNTIFVSTKGYAQHAARIKIAVDPPIRSTRLRRPRRWQSTAPLVNIYRRTSWSRQSNSLNAIETRFSVTGAARLTRLNL